MTKQMMGVRLMDLHSWKSSECGGKCERIYRADEVDAEIEKLRAALTVSRGQWIHSVNAEQCMIALGLEDEWREIQTQRNAHEPKPNAFDQYPVGTLFQKQADGMILAMTPSGETKTVAEWKCDYCAVGNEPNENGVHDVKGDYFTCTERTKPNAEGKL